MREVERFGAEDGEHVHQSRRRQIDERVEPRLGLIEFRDQGCSCALGRVRVVEAGGKRRDAHTRQGDVAQALLR